jgi:hypothetical protein
VAESVLERAYVGLRVAALGKLLLRQPGCQANPPQAFADLPREWGIVDSGLGFADSSHAFSLRPDSSE